MQIEATLARRFDPNHQRPKETKMADRNLGADSPCSNDNIIMLPAPRLNPGVPMFDPNDPGHIRLWNSTWAIVEHQAARIQREAEVEPEPARPERAAPSYLVKMPKTWDEVLQLLNDVQLAWDTLDLDDDAESARVSDMHDRAMMALTRFPSPNAEALVHKIRTLHHADRIQCDPETLELLCGEVATGLAIKKP